ncbi:2-iminoacetate synthase ThiH [bacterium]|nr:2-iminoacetate synthase ThiH [bacterium]
MFQPDFALTDSLLKKLNSIKSADIFSLLATETTDLEKFALLLSPELDISQLKKLSTMAYQETRKRFGRAISLYIPLYYDNRCINGCTYCGFNVHNTIRRRVLSEDEILHEAKLIREKSFKSILLVAGEHPQSADTAMLTALISKLHKVGFSCVSIEIAPLSEESYRHLRDDSHLDGLYVYQETYNQKRYSEVHPSGPKSDYSYRLETPARGAQAGIPRIGVGFLLGLHNDWREEALNLAQHLLYLQKYHWQAEYSISFPRINEAEGVSDIYTPVSDRHFIQLISALRLLFPFVGMSLSTRETPEFRDKLTPLCFTNLSAGSSTAPGGYSEESTDLEQFEIADERAPAQIAEMLKQHGFDPVWKDWE